MVDPPTGGCIYDVTDTHISVKWDPIAGVDTPDGYYVVFFRTVDGVGQTGRWHQSETFFREKCDTGLPYKIEVRGRIGGVWSDYIEIDELCATQPEISSIMWSPKGTTHLIANGSLFRGIDGTAFKVSGVGPSTSPPLEAEEALVEIGTATAKVYKRGESFTLDGEGYTVLHIVSDWECSNVTIARNDSPNQHPSIGEEVQFAATIDWKDDGATETTRRMEWFYLKPESEHITEAYAGDLNNWTHFATETLPAHTFNDAGDIDILYIKVIARNKADKTHEFGIGYCGIGQFNLWRGADGFEITVIDANETDNLSIGCATLVPGTNAWLVDPNILRWDNVANQVYFGTRDSVGCAYSVPAPSMCGPYKMVVGSKYAIYRSTSFITVVPGDSVFELASGRTAVTIDRAYQNFLETTICGLFGISGSECIAFVAELYDPVFVVNYISIVQTGKDTFGNERELTGFDHIALPFSVLGSLPVLSFLPFGALITKGLGALSKTGVKFSDEAAQFMLNFSAQVRDDVISSKDTWHFLDAIGQVTEEHATEIINALTDGDLTRADSLLRQYMGESKGWWNYHTLNDMLRDALPADVYAWMRKQTGLPEIGSGTFINTAKKTTLSEDDIAKISSAAADSSVMDEATSAVYNSLENMGTASATKIDELRNVLKNSPDIAVSLGDKYNSILARVVDGGEIHSGEMAAMVNHAIVAPDDIAKLFKFSVDPEIIPILADGTSNQAFGNFIDVIQKHHNAVDGLGEVNVNKWVQNNAEITKKAMDSADPAKMSDIPHAGQEIADKQGEFVADYCGGHTEPCYTDLSDILYDSGKSVANEIGEVTQVFPDEVPSNWYTKARGIANRIPSKIVKKWKGLKRHEKVLVIWFMVDNMAFMVYMLAKFLGLGPGDRGFDAWNLGKSVTDASWLCKSSCEDKRYDDLESDIEILETAIANLEDYLNDHETALKLENNYDAPFSVLEVGKSALKLYQECLVNKGIEIAPETGKIEFICVDEDDQPIICAAYVDDRKVGVVWDSGLMIDEVNPGTYDLKMYAGGYTDCEKTVVVSAGGYEIFKCVMEKVGGCSKITDVRMYLDPLSPLENETISFNGSADSDDPITEWEWDFDDGSPNKIGQAVTHTYDDAGIYEVSLTVVNDCGESETTARNITVSEEEPGEEAGTLLVEKPIDAVTGDECTRAWEAEIYVDNQTLGKTAPFSIPFGTDVYIGGHGGPCGEHDIKIVLSGYDSVTKTVTIDDGDSKVWTPEMYREGTTPPPATPTHEVSFSVPIGSTVYIDGELLGTTSVKRLAMILRELRK